MLSSIPFTQITAKLPYPAKVKAKLSTIHAEIVNYVIAHFHNSANYKSKVISVLNTISFIVVSGDTIPMNWTPLNPFNEIEFIDVETALNALGELFIYDKSIIWDIEESESETPQHTPRKIEVKVSKKEDYPTTTEDLSLKPPVIPSFDITKPWLDTVKDSEEYTIYTSLPIIPEVQRDISVTTNADLMTRNDFMNLYPRNFVRTRAAAMYEKTDGLEFDDKLGVIIPIEGFTAEQVRDNIIRYPHFYRLKRKIDGQFLSFYSNIEIGGVLHDTLEIWDTLPESKLIPKTSEFIKEYVIRRYLLERDILKIQHKYPLFGKLESFVTLFTTAADYAEFGFTDTENIARECVNSRIQYLQSRNPIIRKVYDLP